MAGTTRKKTSSSGGRKRSTNSTTRKSTRKTKQQLQRESAMFHEICLFILVIIMLILFLCNFGIIGRVGDAISNVLFGIFGFAAYIAPIVIFIAFAFWFANTGSSKVIIKLIAGIVLFINFGIICDLISNSIDANAAYDLKEIYTRCSEGKLGGGVISGSISYLLKHYIETIGTLLVVILGSLVSLIILTEKSLLEGLKNGSKRIAELSREDAERRRENAQARRDEAEAKREENELRRENERLRKEEERRLKAEEKENEKILRMDKKVSGVTIDTSIAPREDTKRRDDVHEIVYNENEEPIQEYAGDTETEPVKEPEVVHIPEPHTYITQSVPQIKNTHQVVLEETESELQDSQQEIRIHKEGIEEDKIQEARKPVQVPRDRNKETVHEMNPPKEASHIERKIPQKYMFPPLSRLQKGVVSSGDSAAELKDTAFRLQQTLGTFGVKVTITDISQGPSVTRYELQPEQGVKVSKIVGLADDIKLNLAATDIRIEAPIPGKAAIGIEVPNKENTAVALRDLLESKEFREFQSNIAFAVGKDIAGKVVVTDIAKMPHMLIAGATGSGKSVCINTIIMSILYKAHPDDVKMILIDPKVVELNVYNGIPHLLIPVVTDPKKASGALHWGVTEMEDRYRKFADFNVRDLKGYNKKVEGMKESGAEDAPEKLPQIIIIVDELADLMMVCPGEVEESICRLAQLARAAGIHLIIATQRPSVDVITGLIKANMPSRIAFSVTSGVDSRTILDMNGAEKLLGKGDMLFYPQGYSKPARIQGAFVSDREVSDVVDFLKNQNLGNIYAEDIEEKIKNIGTGSSGASGGGSESDLDELFEKAGRLVIEKENATIGMLQRAFKIGFNRAARIMDQLSEYGVVGEAEGTKPRKIVMSPEQFEQLIEERL